MSWRASRLSDFSFNFDFFAGSDMMIFTDLVDLFEASAAEGIQVLDVIGSDVGKFCDEFMYASVTNTETLREKLDKEVIEKFNKDG